MPTPFTIERIDHFVLTVLDINATCDFYARTLGMAREDFGDGRTALTFGNQKINLHPYPSPYEPKAVNPVTGAGDFCLITETPVAEVQSHIESQGVDILIGPSERTGAKGRLISIYFIDPDGNLVEVSNYV